MYDNIGIWVILTMGSFLVLMICVIGIGLWFDYKKRKQEELFWKKYRLDQLEKKIREING